MLPTRSKLMAAWAANCEPKRSDNALQIRKGSPRLAFENNVTDYIISTVLYGLYDGI